MTPYPERTLHWYIIPSIGERELQRMFQLLAPDPVSLPKTVLNFQQTDSNVSLLSHYHCEERGRTNSPGTLYSLRILLSTERVNAVVAVGCVWYDAQTTRSNSK